MGNNRFKLSDMIPNAWFYKLKDMSSRSRKRNGPHVMKNNKATSPTTTASQRSQSRYSHYFPTELPTTTRAGKLFNTPIHTKDLDIPSFTDSPRRSSKRRARRKTIYKPSPSVVVPSSLIATSNNNNYDDDSTSNWTKPFHHAQSPDYDLSSIETSSESDDLHECVYSESDCDSFSVPDLLNGIASNCSCRVSSSTNDIIIDMNNESFHRNPERVDGYDAIPEHGLAPMLTKQVKFDDKVIEATESRSLTESSDELRNVDQSVSIKEESSRSQRRRKGSHVARKPSPNSNGIRLRVNSPKLASRKIQASARRSVSSSSASKGSRNAGFPDGFAVVKSSIDPQSDFRESMVEMIVENNIQASKDLEDLLACYLSLNSSEYHDLIVKAFEQIWYDMSQLRM